MPGTKTVLQPSICLCAAVEVEFGDNFVILPVTNAFTLTRM
jgi:hypothetical protein